MKSLCKTRGRPHLLAKRAALCGLEHTALDRNLASRHRSASDGGCDVSAGLFSFACGSRSNAVVWVGSQGGELAGKKLLDERPPLSRPVAGLRQRAGAV